MKAVNFVMTLFLVCIKQFRIILVQVLCADFALSLLVDRVCLWLLGEGKLLIK
jgi:hypothetical protein